MKIIKIIGNKVGSIEPIFILGGYMVNVFIYFNNIKLNKIFKNKKMDLLNFNRYPLSIT